MSEPFRVSDYMSTPVVVVTPHSDLAHVRRLMLRYRIGRVVVIDEAEKPVGIVTMSDFVRLVAERFSSKPLVNIAVADIMTRDPVTIRDNRSLREAARLMIKHGVSGLPVVDEDGKLVGIITKSDIVRAFAEKLRGKFKVRDYMEADFPDATPWHSIYYVADLLYNSPVKRVLVVEGERLLGIIAPSDIAFLSELPMLAKTRIKPIRRFAELPKGRMGPVYSYVMLTAQDVMTPSPVTIGPDEDLALAAQLMLRHGFSSVPVVEDETPVGIVVKHNILKAIAGV
ncbi:CBS domain-containing protein [Hyperthermus butylicus]|uniref:Conserved archaeal protein n=1 Tax=Hyperthermus butylicus (strain DSM 5456 / JCM 9403 / PLM1-5) TaxID=415426 RepID=A2BLX4_HYPBU|nr:CBS domain-containing protein [Hyperthermus butylicus]ABM80985.1 conserved archaeal protein [Hyperthermus butylicus DSM 5456]